MEKSIDTLELKDTKFKKVKKILEQVGEKELKKIRKKLSDFSQEHDDLYKRVKNHSAALNIKEQEGWVSSLEKDIHVEDNKILDVEHQLERLNLNLFKQKIKEKLRLLDPNTDIEK